MSHLSKYALWYSHVIYRRILSCYNTGFDIATSPVTHFRSFHFTGVSTAEGTAEPEVDYVPFSTILQFAPYQLTMELDISLIDNDNNSPNDSEMLFFYVAVSSVNGDGHDEPIVTSTVFIKDDECKLRFYFTCTNGLGF